MALTAPQQAFRSDVPALGPERSVVWPRRLRQRLSNGLEVVLVESHSIPKFTAQLFFRSGNADTVPGLAEMTATVARTGTSRRASRQIEDDLRNLYVIAFTPPESARDGRFHKLEVKTIRKELVVRARNGYYSQ